MTIFINAGSSFDNIEQAYTAVREAWASDDKENSYYKSKYGKLELPEGIHLSGKVVKQKEPYQQIHLDGVPAQCGMAMMYQFDFCSQAPFIIKVLQMCSDMKYKAVMVTLNEAQSDRIKLLKELGFEDVFSWRNTRTQNKNDVLIKIL